MLFCLFVCFLFVFDEVFLFVCFILLLLVFLFVCFIMLLMFFCLFFLFAFVFCLFVFCWLYFCVYVCVCVWGGVLVDTVICVPVDLLSP